MRLATLSSRSPASRPSYADVSRASIRARGRPAKYRRNASRDRSMGTNLGRWRSRSTRDASSWARAGPGGRDPGPGPAPGPSTPASGSTTPRLPVPALSVSPPSTAPPRWGPSAVPSRGPLRSPGTTLPPVAPPPPSTKPPPTPWKPRTGDGEGLEVPGPAGDRDPDSLRWWEPAAPQACRMSTGEVEEEVAGFGGRPRDTLPAPAPAPPPPWGGGTPGSPTPPLPARRGRGGVAAGPNPPPPPPPMAPLVPGPDPAPAPAPAPGASTVDGPEGAEGAWDRPHWPPSLPSPALASAPPPASGKLSGWGRESWEGTSSSALNATNMSWTPREGSPPPPPPPLLRRPPAQPPAPPSLSLPLPLPSGSGLEASPARAVDRTRVRLGPPLGPGPARPSTPKDQEAARGAARSGVRAAAPGPQDLHPNVTRDTGGNVTQEDTRNRVCHAHITLG